MRAFGLGAAALAFGIGSAAAADWPKATHDKIEGAVANMLTLDRPESIGLVTLTTETSSCNAVARTIAHPLRGRRLVAPAVARADPTGAGSRRSRRSAGRSTQLRQLCRDFPADAPAKRLATEIEMALSEGYAVDPESIEVRTDWVKKEPCPPRVARSLDLAGSITTAASSRLGDPRLRVQAVPGQGISIYLGGRRRTRRRLWRACDRRSSATARQQR